MPRTNDSSVNTIRPGSKEALAYLAFPILLVSLGVIWPLISPPVQTPITTIDPVARRALIDQWNETYITQPVGQLSILAHGTPSANATFVASH